MIEFSLGVIAILILLAFIVMCGLSKTLTEINDKVKNIHQKFEEIKFIVNGNGRIQ